MKQPLTPRDHSIELEQAVLGTILFNNDICSRLDGVLEHEHFFEPLHQNIFDVCVTLVRMGKRADPKTIIRFLPADTDVGGITLKQYVVKLAVESMPVNVAIDYAQVIRDYADMRAAASTFNQLFASETPSPVDSITQAIDGLDAIIAGRSSATSSSSTMAQTISSAIDSAALAYKNDGAITGIPTGLRDLDRKLLGFKRGELVIIAGRPGSGKSALLASVARNAALLRRHEALESDAITGHRGMLFSLEMGKTSLGQRMIADEMFDRLRMTYHKMQSGRFSANEFEPMTEAAKRLANLPIQIEEQPALSLAQISTKARQHKRRHGLDWIGIDHIGLMKASARYQGNRVQEIGEITSGFKALAKELDIAVVALAQLNRGVEGREDKRPAMADLRASGNIEEDADTIIMVYREVYYLQRKEPQINTPEHALWQTRMEETWLKMQAIVEKQRNGPIGSVELFCDIGANAIRNADYELAKRSAQLNGQDLLF